MSSELRAGTAWYGMRPTPADDGSQPKNANVKKVAPTTRRKRLRRHPDASGTALIAPLG